jgi:hypothetical protein
MHNAACLGWRGGSLDWHRYGRHDAALHGARHDMCGAGRNPSGYLVLDRATGVLRYGRYNMVWYRRARCDRTRTLGRSPGGAHNCAPGIGTGIGSGIDHGIGRCKALGTSDRSCAGRSRGWARRPRRGSRQNAVRDGGRTGVPGTAQSTRRRWPTRPHNHPPRARPCRTPRHAGDRQDANSVCGLFARRARRVRGH